MSSSYGVDLFIALDCVLGLTHEDGTRTEDAEVLERINAAIAADPCGEMAAIMAPDAAAQLLRFAREIGRFSGPFRVEEEA
jgi:hypothetical protein